ncbi:MAG: hypothetical protein ACRDPO_12685, partial [Streptosporangiaceae bacterium]
REGAGLLAAAAAIRARGDRPGPPALRAAVDQATARLASRLEAAQPVTDPNLAASQALSALADLTARLACRY